ncbi:MAG TPA: iron ABC transporter permease [Nitrolancea sp.]|nr:iron ABC transporter permease [Nitrolancea sp.]
MGQARVEVKVTGLRATSAFRSPVVGVILGLVVLVVCLMTSLAYGSAEIRPGTVLAAFTAFDGSPEHLIVRTVRVPRALIGMSVGACLGVAGAIMQALTRNPLASPGILGINAGAAFMVVGSIFLFGVASLNVYIWFAFLGAGVTAIVVYLLGSAGRRGMTPLKLTLAGAALTAFCSSLMQGILVLNEQTLDQIRFWLGGAVSGRDLGLFLQVLPYMVVGLVTAFLLGKQITTLSLGEEIAKGLGQSTGWVKGIAVAIIVLLAGSSVAIAGPISFVGLAVPHIARSLAGTDYRWVLPYAAILGAILLLVADLGARFVIYPSEIPVGVMTALIGAPFFIYLVRRGVRKL